MLTDRAAYLRQLVRRCLAQVEGVMTPVGGAAAAFEESMLLQFVEKLHDPTGHGTETHREVLLAQAGVGRYLAQCADLRRRQAERNQPLGELCRDPCAELGQQERDSGGSLHGRSLLWAGGVDFPVAVPPGIVILLAGAVLVAAVRPTWSAWLGCGLGVFVVLGFLLARKSH